MKPNELREAVEPRVLKIKDFRTTGVDPYVPGCWYTEITDMEGFGEFGLYVMSPGAQTTVFSLESEDDGTADEYYGACAEFYYVISGEVTVYWGKDAERLKRGEGEQLLLEAGDFGRWEKELKYSAKNSGEMPALFFWGLAERPQGAVKRLPVS
jgi:mannose-6-phosphate isomerase-like protein (cupin superfamily)